MAATMPDKTSVRADKFLRDGHERLAIPDKPARRSTDRAAAF
jgi:hypothetical protein